MEKYTNMLKQYKFNIKENELKTRIEEIKKEINITKEKLKTIFSCIDLTSLNTTDTSNSIKEMIDKINTFSQKFPDIQNVAAFCSYPTFITKIKKIIIPQNVLIATVTGFPNAHTYLEVKIAETALAANDGADEIDTVISVDKVLEKKYDEIGEELEEIKYACRDSKLKVILETGAIKDYQKIYESSLIAMYAGADFIKTSTGKIDINATPEAAYIMCQSILDFYEKTNKKVGFKVAGGIRTNKDAMLYYTIVEKILGKEWLNKNHFRIGASKLANELLSEINENKIEYF